MDFAKIHMGFFIGYYFINRFRNRLKEANHYTVAKQLRKMGVPIEITLYILCNKGS